MQPIGVIDLKHHQVVRGIAGRRDEYRPIQSRLCTGSSPGEVAAALASVGVSALYIADLDAIAGAKPDWQAYVAIAKTGLPLLIDSGIKSLDAAWDFNRDADLDLPLNGFIVGLETIPSLRLLEQLIGDFGRQVVVFSLDLAHGRLNSNSDKLSNMPPLEMALRAIDIGVRRMIVLDVAGVGIGEGIPTLPLCRQVRESASSAGVKLQLISGGGIRNIADVHEAERAGCDAVLIASALHDQRISAADLARLR